MKVKWASFLQLHVAPQIQGRQKKVYRIQSLNPKPSQATQFLTPHPNMAKKGTYTLNYLPKSKSTFLLPASSSQSSRTLQSPNRPIPPKYQQLTFHPHSQIPHHLSAPHVHGPNRLLQNPHATACPPTSQHAEIRSRRYVFRPCRASLPNPPSSRKSHGSLGLFLAYMAYHIWGINKVARHKGNIGASRGEDINGRAHKACYVLKEWSANLLHHSTKEGPISRSKARWKIDVTLQPSNSSYDFTWHNTVGILWCTKNCLLLRPKTSRKRIGFAHCVY